MSVNTRNGTIQISSKKKMKKKMMLFKREYHRFIEVYHWS